MFSLSVLNSNVMERFLFMAFRKIWEQKDAMKCFFFFYYSGCLFAREQYILTVENFNFALLLVLWLD